MLPNRDMFAIAAMIATSSREIQLSGMHVSGRAIVFATLINAAGFLGLSISSFPPLRQFGLMTSSAFLLVLLTNRLTIQLSVVGAFLAGQHDLVRIGPMLCFFPFFLGILPIRFSRRRLLTGTGAGLALAAAPAVLRQASAGMLCDDGSGTVSH